MSTTAVSFGVQLTPDDLYRANVSFLARKLWFFCLIPILAVVSTILSFLSHAQQRDQLLLNVRPLLYLLGIWLLLVFIFPYFSARSIFKSQKGLHQPTRYTFSEEGIQTESETASSRMDWSNIYRAVETSAYFFVYTAKNIRFVLPKRSISDQTQIADLREILRRNIKGKTKLRG
jgi:YcxB-like protein